MSDALTATFAALADPTRRAILTQLAHEEATVNVLARPFPVSLQAISRHLKVLEAAGLITRGRNAQFRPCRFETASMNGVLAWIEGHLKGIESTNGQDEGAGPVSNIRTKGKDTTGA